MAVRDRPSAMYMLAWQITLRLKHDTGTVVMHATSKYVLREINSPPRKMSECAWAPTSSSWVGRVQGEASGTRMSSAG